MKAFSSIVLSGGVFKAASIIGVIKYLEEQQLIKNLKTFVGTSAGAVICFLLSLGYSSIEIRNLLLDIISDKTLNQLNIDDICNVFQTYGVDSGYKLEIIFRKALHIKTFRQDITFMDFAKLTGKDLVICVSNLTKEQSEFWCIDTHPTTSVIQALRISCSIPVVFSPVTVNDMIYVDGGVYNNFPLSYFDNKQFKDLIGINIKATNYQDTGDFLSYMRFLIYSVIEKSYVQPTNDLKNNVINIYFDDREESTTSYTDFQINISESTIDKYISVGYETIACLAKSTSFTEL